MPVPTDPYTFSDGPGNTASGVQVNQRFTPLYQTLNPAVIGIDYLNVQNNGLREINMATGANGLAKGAFFAWLNVAQSIPNNTNTTILFDTDNTTPGFDVSGWLDITTNKGRFTPQLAGYYRFSWLVTAGAAILANTYWQSRLHKNSTDFALGMTGYQIGSAIAVSSGGSAIALANGTTDYFDIGLVHNEGVSRNTATTAANMFFCGEFIGRS